MNLAFQKADIVGAFASSLCVVHCLATPIIFIAHACGAGGCESAPAWWRSLDFFFLLVSFFAVYHSTRTTTIKAMKPALWMSWVALFLVILFEQLNWFSIPKAISYATALSLVVLHLYNLRCKGRC